MRVPAEAGLGTARVTLSFAAWKEGHVALGHGEVPVVATVNTVPAAKSK